MHNRPLTAIRKKVRDFLWTYAIIGVIYTFIVVLIAGIMWTTNRHLFRPGHEMSRDVSSRAQVQYYLCPGAKRMGLSYKIKNGASVTLVINFSITRSHFGKHSIVLAQFILQIFEATADLKGDLARLGTAYFNGAQKRWLGRRATLGLHVKVMATL